MKMLLTLVSSLILLNGCTSLFSEPQIVTEFSVQKVDIPQVLLTPATPPSPELLKNVKICKGATELTEYGKQLLYCNYENTAKD